MANIKLACSCGKVQGFMSHGASKSGTRVVCYCADCQAFAQRLGRQGDILDEQGGTDIFQILPSQIQITQGLELLNCLRLSSKGVYRWYTSCCHTPVANTVSLKLPFVALIHNFIKADNNLHACLGPIRFHIHGKYALGDKVDIRLHKKVPFAMLLRVIPKLTLAKMLGKGRPNPFYDVHGRAISKPHIAQIKP